jgi:hypothetical protein
MTRPAEVRYLVAHLLELVGRGVAEHRALVARLSWWAKSDAASDIRDPESSVTRTSSRAGSHSLIRLAA